MPAYNGVVLHVELDRLAINAMLMKTAATDTANIREDSGKNAECVDSSLLFNASRIASEAADGLRTSRGNDDWVVLFQALAELTALLAEVGDPAPRFTRTKLQAKCADIDPQQKTYWLSEEDTGRKKFSNAWKELAEAFPGLERNLQQRAEKSAVPGRVVPVCDNDPQDKRIRLYGFQVAGIELPERSVPAGTEKAATSAEQSGVVRIDYVEEMEVYPIPWLRRPLRLNVHGWRGLSLVLPPVVFLMVIAIASWVLLQLWVSSLPVRSIGQWTLVVGLVVAELGWFAWPLYRLLEDRIIIAPAFLQIAYAYEHVLLIRKERDLKTLWMVRFTGTCPLCGALVEVSKGSGAFRGRLVGKCADNPVEHLYSFDHVLRHGQWLRR